MCNRLFSLLGSIVLLGTMACTVAAQAQTAAMPAGRLEASLKVAGGVDPAIAEEADADAGATNSTGPGLFAAAAGNYTFATSTTASLVDMSSGTSTLIPANQDDVASAVTLTGFDFYFQGTRQDRFSVNSNGSLRFGATAISTTAYDPLGVAGQSLITAYGADQRTHIGNGKVHFKVIGAAPNRELVVEWLNMQADFNSGGTVDLTYQLHLFETTGAIEFVYGSMAMSAAGAADANSNSPQIGFSSGNTVGTVGSITAAQSGVPAPTFSGAAAAPFNNPYVAGSIVVLSSAVDGARRSFSLTPPAVTAPGAPLTFTAVSATGMTLNWTDSPNEVGYAIYVSTDGINYSFVNTAAQDATSFVASGLLGATNYFWQVYAFSEGDVAFIAGSQATATPPPNASLATGLWSNPGTWSTGVVPTANDAVTITGGTTVTIDIAAVAYSVSIASTGVLQYEQTTAQSLTVGTDVTVQNGGTFQSNPAGTQVAHVLSIAGNLVNNGTLDFSTNADTAGAIITFTGVTNTSFSGNGITTDIRQITVNKGTTRAPIVEVMPTNFTVRGVTTDTVVGGWLVLTNGTIKISGTFAGTSRVFGVAAYTIGATTGFWLNNPNYVVAGQTGNATVTGLFHVSQGTFNVGTATGNALGLSAGSTTLVDGGAINAAGRVGIAVAATAINYTQSGGTITVNTVGNATALGSFDLGTSLASNINISGGSIVCQLASTAVPPIDYRNQAGGGIAGVTGGTLQLGNAASGAAKNFTIRGVVPNLLLTNTSANHTGTYSTTLANYNNISLNVTVNAGNTMNFANVVFLFDGTLLTNNGTITHNGASSNFVWFNAAAPITYTGSGVVTAPMTNFAVQADQGLTLSAASPSIPATAVRLFSGNIINSSKLIVGNGGATAATIQIGNTTTPTAAGVFDSAPTFNPGTAGTILSYLRTTASRTMGPEVNPTRVITTFTFDDNDVTHTLTQTGGDLSVTGTAAFTNGHVITGANTFIIGAAGTVTRTTGYVDGNLKKTYAAVTSKNFEVGSPNGYTPVLVNATAGTFPSDVTLNSVQSQAPNISPPGKAIIRYWNVTAPLLTSADLTFNYLDPTDLGTAVEANLVLYRQDGTTYTNLGGTENTAANNLAQTGITTFGLFTLGEPGEIFLLNADLGITKTDGVTTATPGGSVIYTIVASNAGPDSVTGATVADNFPAIQTCNWTCSGAGGATCGAGASGNINDLANLPTGGSATYVATCTISSSATGSMSNIATITAPGNVNDGVPGNNSATDTDTLNPSADLSVTKTDGVTTATAGGSVTYTITASNAGPSDAPGSTVADTFPASESCSWTCAVAGGATCTPNSGNINDLINLPSGGSATYTATCNISASTSGALSNTATVAAAGGVTDPVPGNNSATDTDTVTGTADLAITKTDGVTTATPGGSVTYTIVATNATGPSDVSGAIVADTFPASLSCSWTCSGAGNGTCPASGTGNINSSVNIPSGGSTTFIASCTISSAATGTLSNTATVTAPAGVTDASGNNSATDSDTLNASSDLAITKTDGVTTATPGGSVTYTITASNAGPSDTVGATVADTFPASLSCTWTCSGAGNGTCTALGSGNISDLVNLPSGGSSTYTASCTISASATGTLSNTATVTAPGSVTDPDPSNNSASDSDTLNPSADLAITKTDGSSTATPGGNLTYTIVASNPGPSDVIGATVADTFPAAETCSWTCTGAGSGTCTASGSGNISDLVNLPSGGSATYIASCAVSLSVTGTLSNTATVAVPAGVTDPTPGNNSATDNDTVSAVANLTVTVNDGHAYARYGQLLNYLVKVSNAGPSNASDISISESTSPDFATAGAHWTCIGGDAGASCTPSGNGLLSDSNVVIPVSRSLTWLVSISVLNNAPDSFADNTFTVNTAADINAPYQVLDSDQLVLFRDGFEPGLQDGTGAASPPLTGVPPTLNAVATPFAFGQSLTFSLPSVVGSRSIDTLVQARAIDGSGFRVERLNLGTVPRVRVVSIDLLGMESASEWAQTENAAQVVVGLIGDQGTSAMLATTGGEETLQLSSQVHEVYQVRAVGTASITH